MEIILERKIHKSNSTEGNLYVNNKWFAHTIEDVVRALPGEWNKSLKVYAKTAIPYGRYPIMVTWSNRFQQMMPGVFNVPDFEGIRIHWGTTENSSAGCIIISKQDTPGNGIVFDKSATIQLRKAIVDVQKKEKVWITIADTKEEADEIIKKAQV